MNVPNKLECLFLDKSFLSNLTYACEEGDYFLPIHQKGAPLMGKLCGLLANIILCWKGLPVTNALAYLEKRQKSFITLTPGFNVIKLFTVVIYECY
jgi:hypothetical protein